MHELKRTALLSCSVQQMFAVITAVERYPEFVPYCVNARVQPENRAGDSPQANAGDAQSSTVLASLDLSARGFSEQFTTRNIAVPFERIEMQLVRGPFSHFSGLWTLTPIGAQGCRVDLHVRFEFRRGLVLLSRIVSRSLMQAADHVVDAFCQRAESSVG